MANILNLWCRNTIFTSDFIRHFNGIEAAWLIIEKDNKRSFLYVRSEPGNLPSLTITSIDEDVCKKRADQYLEKIGYILK